MKKIFTNPIAIAVALAITLYFYFIFKSMTDVIEGPYPFNSSINLPESDTAFGGLFYTPYINDSLPYYKYRKIEDSLKKVKDILEYENKSIGAGNYIGFIGVSAILNSDQIFSPNLGEPDTVSVMMQDSMKMYYKEAMHLSGKDSLATVRKVDEILWRLNVHINKVNDSLRAISEKKYYLSLKGYHLDYETKFFVQNGMFNLAYVKWDKVIKRTYDSTKVGHYERKAIPLRYTTTEQTVLIPVSKSMYDGIYTGIIILRYLLFFITAYFFIGYPIQILISISKGKAFSKENISRLNAMSIVLFAYAVIITVAPFIIHFFFRKLIPTDFQVTSFASELYSNLLLYFACVVVLAIGISFKRGFKLQQEQELTV